MSSWAKYVAVTDRQAYALDRMADENGFADGAELLADVAEVSRSKLSKMASYQLRKAVDDAFRTYGSKP